MTLCPCGIINLTGHDTDGHLGEIGKMVTWQRKIITMVIIICYNQNPDEDKLGIIIITNVRVKNDLRR